MPPKSIEEPAGHSQEALRLVSEKTGWPDQILDFSWIGHREGVRVRVSLEQSRRHHIHPLIGALGAQDRGNEELVRVSKVKLAMCVGIGTGEPLEYQGCSDGGWFERHI